MRNTIPHVGDSHCSFSLASKMVTPRWGEGRNWWMSLPEKNTKCNVCKVRTEFRALAIHKLGSLPWILTWNHFILVEYELKSNHFGDILCCVVGFIRFAWNYIRTLLLVLTVMYRWFHYASIYIELFRLFTWQI